VEVGKVHNSDIVNDGTKESVLSLLSSVGFIVVGCLELYMKETFWTKFFIGGMMVLASILGVTANLLSLLYHDESAVSVILTAVSLHVYAMVAVSIFALHEDLTDETASATTSRGDRSNESDRGKQQKAYSKMPPKPSLVLRRLADNAFMIGTILDAILSYFRVFDMPSAAAALAIASVGASCCWVLAAILFLLLTIQTVQQCKSMDRGREASWCWCHCCSFHSCSRNTTQFSDQDSFTTRNVTITVVEGDYTSSAKQDFGFDEGFFSYYGRQIMESNIDTLSSGESQPQSSCIYPSIGDNMNAAGLGSSANILKQVDTIFDQHLFCG
jgi:hypothetical protein